MTIVTINLPTLGFAATVDIVSNRTIGTNNTCFHHTRAMHDEPCKVIDRDNRSYWYPSRPRVACAISRHQRCFRTNTPSVFLLIWPHHGREIHTFRAGDRRDCGHDFKRRLQLSAVASFPRKFGGLSSKPRRSPQLHSARTQEGLAS